MNNSITVIIPVYGPVPYLRDGLLSVHSQTYRLKNPDGLNIFLLIDGECPDAEKSIPPEMKSYVQVFPLPHQGVSQTRNEGIKLAQNADLIAFLDGDDLWCPQKLEMQINLLEENPPMGMVYTNSFWIGQNGKVLNRTQKDQYGVLPEGFIFEKLLERNYIITSSILVRKKVLDELGGFDPRWNLCEDWELNLRISRQFKVGAIKTPMIYYRLHAGGNHYRLEKMLQAGYEIFDHHFSSLPEEKKKQLKSLKGNVPLNLAGSCLYIHQGFLSRQYLREARVYMGVNLRILLMYVLSFCPRVLRNFLLGIRDRISFLP